MLLTRVLLRFDYSSYYENINQYVVFIIKNSDMVSGKWAHVKSEKGTTWDQTTHWGPLNPDPPPPPPPTPYLSALLIYFFSFSLRNDSLNKLRKNTATENSKIELLIFILYKCLFKKINIFLDLLIQMKN